MRRCDPRKARDSTSPGRSSRGNVLNSTKNCEARRTRRRGRAQRGRLDRRNRFRDRRLPSAFRRKKYGYDPDQSPQSVHGVLIYAEAKGGVEQERKAEKRKKTTQNTPPAPSKREQLQRRSQAVRADGTPLGRSATRLARVNQRVWCVHSAGRGGSGSRFCAPGHTRTSVFRERPSSGSLREPDDRLVAVHIAAPLDRALGESWLDRRSAVVWSLVGTVPTTLSAPGSLPQGGLREVVAPAAGTVAELNLQRARTWSGRGRRLDAAPKAAPRRPFHTGEGVVTELDSLAGRLYATRGEALGRGALAGRSSSKRSSRRRSPQTLTQGVEARVTPRRGHRRHGFEGGPSSRSAASRGPPKRLAFVLQDAADVKGQGPRPVNEVVIAGPVGAQRERLRVGPRSRAKRAALRRPARVPCS